MQNALRISLICTALMAVSLGYAEPIPTNYYDGIDGKSDSVLKSTLSLIVRGGVRYEYGTNQYHSTANPPQWEKGDLKAYGTWQAFPLTDRRKDGTIWDMYSNCERYYPNKQGESGCSLNIEHCFPKSWWGGEVNDAYKDLYHLNPSDQRANGQKSNYPPGHVVKGDKFDNGSFRMDSKTKSQYGFICFEPAEEYRGDFARAYFYIATAYENYTWVQSTTGFDVSTAITNDSYLEFKPWLMEVLLDWHRADPVSEKEICRAEVISGIQHNRNPYIDYPELVEYIWGSKQGQPVTLSELTCTYGTCTCEPYTPVPLPCVCPEYDTLISLPAITAALVNAIQGDIKGSANSGVQSNGSASATMGKAATDGEITFTGLNASDTTLLVFRASPYNSATGMQLDVYADDVLVRTIQVTVEKETRNEVWYRITIPKGTQSLRIVSVGGSTTKRACMQELYLLKLKPDTETILSTPTVSQPAARKVLRNGRMYIIVGDRMYSILGL